MSEVRVVRSWDALPAVVFEQVLHGEVFSTRVLERQHRTMKDALESIVNIGIDPGSKVGLCREIAMAALEEIK